MQPVVEQAAHFAPGCSTCGTATATVYDAAPSSGCANCTTNYADQAVYQSAPYQAPASAGVGTGSNVAAPPSTFREPDPRNEPTPASGTSASEANKNWEPPQLFGPSDKQVKRPSTTVWTAVYEQPAATNRPVTQAVAVSQATPIPAKPQPKVTWVAVE